jgi:hypothetical protein
MTEDEWLTLLGRAANFQTVTDLDSLANRIVTIATKWGQEPLTETYPDWTVGQLRTAATVYAGAIAAAGAAGDLDAQLRALYSGWDDSVVAVIAGQAHWPKDMDPAIAERLAADTQPMLVDAWHSIRESIYVFGNPFIGAQVSIVGNWRVDEDDLRFLIDSFGERGYVAQHISPQGAGGEWVLVLHWLGDHTLDTAFSSFITLLGGRLVQRRQSKGKDSPNRIDIYREGEKVASYEIKEPEKG